MADLWPYFPMPEIREELRWLTDVLKTRTIEDRTALRPARRAYTLAYSLGDPQATVMQKAYEARPYDNWLLPLWTEASEAAVAAADTVLIVETDASYTDKVLIFAGCNNYVLADIAAIGAGEITLTAPVGVDIARALICPVTAAYVEGGIESARSSIRGQNFTSITFVERDNPATEATGFDQFEGLDLVTGCLSVSPLSTSVQPVVVIIDNGAGPVVIEPVREVLDQRYTMNWAMTTFEKRRTFHKWLNYIRGRDRAFWLTGWRNELVLAAPIGAADTSILVEPVLPNIEDYIGMNVMVDDGVRSARQITAATVSAGNHRLYVSSLGRAVSTARVSFLRKVRLDSDVVEIAHHRGFTARCDFPVVGVPA